MFGNCERVNTFHLPKSVCNVPLRSYTSTSIQKEIAQSSIDTNSSIISDVGLSQMPNISPLPNIALISNSKTPTPIDIISFNEVISKSIQTLCSVEDLLCLMRRQQDEQNK